MLYKLIHQINIDLGYENKFMEMKNIENVSILVQSYFKMLVLTSALGIESIELFQSI